MANFSFWNLRQKSQRLPQIPGRKWLLQHLLFFSVSNFSLMTSLIYCMCFSTVFRAVHTEHVFAFHWAAFPLFSCTCACRNFASFAVPHTCHVILKLKKVSLLKICVCRPFLSIPLPCFLSKWHVMICICMIFR